MTVRQRAENESELSKREKGATIKVAADGAMRRNTNRNLLSLKTRQKHVEAAAELRGGGTRTTNLWC